MGRRLLWRREPVEQLQPIKRHKIADVACHQQRQAAIHVPQGERAVRHARAPEESRKAAQAGRLRADSADSCGSARFCGRRPSAGCQSSAHESPGWLEQAVATLLKPHNTLVWSSTFTPRASPPTALNAAAGPGELREACKMICKRWGCV